VGIIVQDVSVLEGAGLGFVTIANKIVGLTVVTADKTPFDPAGESGSATATEVGLLDFINNFLRLHLESLPEFFVPSMLEITIEVGSVPLCPGVLKNDSAFLGVRRKKKGFHQ